MDDLDDDRRIADLLSETEHMFVLWMIHTRLCKQVNDFAIHFGSDYSCWNIIGSLKRRGFVKETNGFLDLTPMGLDAITQLGLGVAPTFEYEEDESGSAEKQSTATGTVTSTRRKIGQVMARELEEKLQTFSLATASAYVNRFGRSLAPSQKEEFRANASQEAMLEVLVRFKEAETRDELARDLSLLEMDEKCDKSRHPYIAAAVQSGIRRVFSAARHRKQEPGLAAKGGAPRLVSLTEQMGEVLLGSVEKEAEINALALGMEQRLTQLDIVTQEIGEMYFKSGMTVRTIAETTGLAQKAIYHHLKTYKDACLAALRTRSES